MAINDPKEPIKNNPFLDLTSSMSKMFSGMEQREKATNDKLDKLIKQMVLYYKLLENSYNKDKVSSKKGREESLNDDKGFLKLIDLMTKIDGNFKKTMDRYVSGQRLQLDEKKELAKFVQTMKDALADSQEQIGVPIKDILTNFKKMVKDEKVSNDFKLDLFSFLREYSDEDLALSKELKGLLDNTLKSGKVNDEKIVNILMELDKNLEYYAENEKEFKTATFAPYKKLDTDLKEANVSLEEVVKLLTDNQRSNDKIEGYLEDQVDQGGTGGKNGKGKDEGGAVSHLAREAKKTAAELADFATVMTGKTMALGMADNPFLSGASPAVFSSADMMGKGVGDIVKNFNPVTDLPKLAAAAEALTPLLPYLAGGALVVGGGLAVKNASDYKGNSPMGQSVKKGFDQVKDFTKGVSQGVSDGLKNLIPKGGVISDTFNSIRGYDKNGKPIKHGALDTSQPLNTPVKSALGGGKVIAVGSDNLSGNYVKIKNPKGTVESVAHLNKQNVKMGDIVSSSSTLGTTGTTGRVRGVGQGQSVLHRKVRDSKGNVIDPVKAVKDYDKLTSLKNVPQKVADSGLDKYKNIFDKYAVGGYNQVASSLQNMGSDTKVTYRLKGMNRDTVTMLSYLGDTLKQDMAEVGTNTQFSNTPTSLSASNAMLDDAKNINNTSSGKNISPEVSPMPSTPSSTQGGGNQVASNQGQMIPVPTPNMEKSDRKLKSDNDLLNHQIDYGDIV